MSKFGCAGLRTATQWSAASHIRSAAYRPFSAVAAKKIRMTTEEAFVKVLQKRGLDNVFGIIGSAMMPISDLFQPPV
jgi:hypothetical protein